LLERDRHVQVAAAVQRQHRPLESPVERNRLLVRSLRAARLLVRRLSAHSRVDRVIGQSEPGVDVILHVGIGPDPVPDIGAAVVDDGAGVVGESRFQAIEGEWTRTSADLHLDASQLTSLVGVARRLAEKFGQFRDVLSTGCLSDSDAGDELSGRGDRCQEIHLARTGCAECQAARKSLRELLHTQKRDVAAHRNARQINA